MVSTPVVNHADKWQTITYSQVSGSTSSFFAVDSSTGVVTVAATLNYETATQHVFRIQAVDSGQ